MRQDKWIIRSGDILGGTPIFAGTGVPVQTLIDYLQAGHSIGEFMEDFPAVDREHAIGALETLKQLNSKGTVLAIFRSAMKQKRGKLDLYFFGLSKKAFETLVSQKPVYVFLQCGSPSSILVIPGEYFQKCYQGVPTSKGDWKINVYNGGKIWTLKPTGKSHVDVSKYLNHYPVLSESD